MLVMHISGCNYCAVHQAALAVDANVQLHSKVPRLVFASLVHFEVTDLVYVLSGAGCSNDGGIHDGAGVDLEASGL